MPFDSKIVYDTTYMSNMCTEYSNEEFFADWFFPIVPGPPTGLVAIKERGAWFRDEAQERGPGAPAIAINYTAGSTSYTTKEYSAKVAITHQDRTLMRYPGNSGANIIPTRTRFLANAIDLKKENIVSAAIVGAGTGWNGETNGEDVEGGWAAATASTFLVDVWTGINDMIKATGRRPNKFAMDHGTWLEVMQDPTVKALLGTANIQLVTTSFLAQYFGLSEVKVLTSVYSTAKEKKDKTDYSGQYRYERNAGKGSAFLFRDEPAPSMEFSGAGIQIRVPYESGMIREMRTWFDENTRNDWFEASETASILQTGAYYGKLFVDTIQD